MSALCGAARICTLAGLLAVSCFAHVGSPDIYLDASAGPYQLYITIQPPSVIPGIAQIQVRATQAGITQLTATPLGMTGASSKFAPIADKMPVSKDDPKFFTGAVWLMQTGSFQIRITANGSLGSGTVSVPIPALAQSTKKMQRGLGAALFVLMSLLVASLAAIAGAGVRDAGLAPGAAAAPRQLTRGRVVMAAVTLALLAVVWFGNKWWNSEASDYDDYIYKPLQMSAAIDPASQLRLTITDPGWLKWRKIDDFIPDHGHLMHLYLIREPAMDVVFHLHPDMTGAGVFDLKLPSVPAGDYRLYADVVHEDGFPETLAAKLKMPRIEGRALSGDDAEGLAPPITSAQSTTDAVALPDGYRMVFEHGVGSFVAKRAELFHFRLLDPQGRAPADMGLYMGMLGHAAFVKSDGTVFAHIHPNGTVAMAAFMMAQPKQAGQAAAPMNMSAMDMSAMNGMPNEVSFPYGFPTAGHYRIIVQMKHGETVETGIFDATAASETAPQTAALK